MFASERPSTLSTNHMVEISVCSSVYDRKPLIRLYLVILPVNLQ